MRTIVSIALLVVGMQVYAEPEITGDVIYGRKDGMALTYDVYRPEGANGAGVIYMVSGGWFSGYIPPQMAMTIFKPLLDEGFTVVAVQHGSAPLYKVPDAASDVRAAVRHIKANAATYGMDPDRLGETRRDAGRLDARAGEVQRAVPGARAHVEQLLVALEARRRQHAVEVGTRDVYRGDCVLVGRGSELAPDGVLDLVLGGAHFVYC